ncbi:hypothetical protein [Natronorubrum halophilum]|uniref:hypothetical protein n=1 Tax=Natronorubrum halophilum TaxID=1702106 RepID=UPI0013CF1915|nr:hypothetical protein [Natronorubrum halophilum]
MGKEATYEEGQSKAEQPGVKETTLQARRQALTDARRTVDQQLISVNDISRKAWRVVQFNGLVATILATLIPSLFNLDQFHFVSIILLAIGISALVYSTKLTYQIQQRQRVQNGPESKLYRRIAEYDYDESTYLSKALNLYANALNNLVQSTESMSEDLNRAVITSAIGLVFLIVATISLLVV